MNLLMPCILILCLYLFPKVGASLAEQSITFALLLYCVAVFVTVLFFHNAEQLKDAFYSLHILLIFIITYYVVTYSNISFSQFFNWFFCLYIALVLLSILQFLGNLGVVPTIWAEDENTPHGIALVRGPSGNPNNLAVMCMLFFSMLHWQAYRLGKKHAKIVLVGITLVILLLTLSRLAVILFFSYFLFFLVYRKQYVKFLIATTSVLFLLTASFVAIQNLEPVKAENESEVFFARNINRIIAIRDITKTTGSSSSSLRLNSYQYFFENIDRAIFPYGSGNYERFYTNTKFDNSLISKNPHSFIIESTLAFGFIAPLLFAFIFFMMCKNILKNRNDKFFLLFAGYFLLLINVPSSILRAPVVWMLLFLVYHLCLKKEKTQSLSQMTNFELKNESKPQ
ncbi:hypothetical protein OM33_04975 [Pseudoalteromonas piratica]|uniref:O-antigen ligase-related domain-containing protein n=2 Tax=Pseudoalteromonas piratica TaxID=1348114 RepID=A0A0A7EEY2_9GAMM|nr:hypothetical protein OM33_04975 [Pseudoalteromonas piratica]